MIERTWVIAPGSGSVISIKGLAREANKEPELPQKVKITKKTMQERKNPIFNAL